MQVVTRLCLCGGSSLAVLTNHVFTCAWVGVAGRWSTAVCAQQLTGSHAGQKAPPESPDVCTSRHVARLGLVFSSRWFWGVPVAALGNVIHRILVHVCTIMWNQHMLQAKRPPQCRPGAAIIHQAGLFNSYVSALMGMPGIYLFLFFLPVVCSCRDPGRISPHFPSGKFHCHTWKSAVKKAWRHFTGFDGTACHKRNQTEW